jgi:phospholipid/cholesterol/gamma-HCH transport system substrate-binding protein
MGKLFSTEAKVGLFGILCLVAFALFTMKISNFSLTPRKGSVIAATFTSLGGLEKEADVTIAGVKVGSVESIGLVGDRAKVLLRLQEGVVLRAGTEAAVATQGLMGERFVELIPGPAGAAPLPEGAVIVGREPMNIDQVLTELSSVGKQVSDLSQSVKSLFVYDETKSPIQMVVERVNTLLDQGDRMMNVTLTIVEESLTTIKALAQQGNDVIAENRKPFAETMNRTNELMKMVNEETLKASGQFADVAKTLKEVMTRNDDRLGRLSESATGSLSQVKEAVDKLNASMDNLSKVSKEMADITDRIARGEGSIGKLVKDEGLFTKLESTAASLEKIGLDLKEGRGTVGKLLTDEKLYQSIDKGIGFVDDMVAKADQLKIWLNFEDRYLTEIERHKTMFGMRLQPNDTKYYEIGIVDTPYRTTTETVTRTIVQDAGGTTVSDETMTEDITEEKIVINALLARRFGPLWLRGGASPSTPGTSERRMTGSCTSPPGWPSGSTRGSTSPPDGTTS